MPLASTRARCPGCDQVVTVYPTGYVRAHEAERGHRCPVSGRYIRLRAERPAEWRVVECPSCGGVANCPRCDGSEVLYIRPSGHVFLHPGGPARGRIRPEAFDTAIRIEVLRRDAA